MNSIRFEQKKKYWVYWTEKKYTCTTTEIKAQMNGKSNDYR